MPLGEIKFSFWLDDGIICKIFVWGGWSKLRLSAKSKDGEFIVSWISLHEALDDKASHEGQTFGGAFSVIYGFFLAAIEFEKEAILLNKGNEVCFYIALNLSLSLLYWLAMLLEDVFVELKPFPNFSRRLSEGFFCEFSQIGVFFDKIGIVIDVVEYRMEESNSSTGILSILFHIEDILAHLVLLQRSSLNLLVVLLQLVDLIKEDQSQDWLAQHLLSPLLHW